MQRLQAQAEKFRYDVVVGRGAWKALRTFPLHSYSSVFVLTEHPLWNRCANAFCRASGLGKARCVFIPAGEKSTEHLKLLARLSRRIVHDEFRAALRAAPDEAAVAALVAEALAG